MGILDRLAGVKDKLQGTKFSFAESEDYVAVTCPWGNRIRCFEPGSRFAGMRLGMPYVELDVPTGAADPIANFYQVMLNAPARVHSSDRGRTAHVTIGSDQELRFAEGDNDQPEFDGHHIAIYIANFSGPHGRLIEKGIVSEESNQHQYRFVDIIDPDRGTPLFKLEHEVRSMRHPMFGRKFINRNPEMTNRNFVTGYEDMAWAAMT